MAVTLENLAQEYPLDAFQLDYIEDEDTWSLSAYFRTGLDEGHEHIERFHFHADTIAEAIELLSAKCVDVFGAPEPQAMPATVLSDN